MTRPIKFFLSAIVFLTTAMAAQAQKLSLTVETMVQTQDNTAFLAETAKTYSDEDGIEKYTAVVKVQFPEDGLTFQGEIIAAEHHKQESEYWVYMRAGASSLKVMHPSYYALNLKFNSVGIGALSSKVTYALKLKAQSGDVDFYEDNKYGLTLGLNYEPISINGPELALGYNFNHFIVEGAVSIGYKYSDYLTIDDTYTTRYSCYRASLRLGYDCKISRRIAFQPQVSLVHSYAVAENEPLYHTDLDNMEYAEANSLGLGARILWAPFGKAFRIHVTPHYNIRITEKNWKALADVDDTIKSWSDGFQLNAGLMLYF